MDQADINLGHQGGIAVLTVFVLDWLKKAAWFPWISNNTEKLNRIISLVIALGTASGLKVLSGDAGHGWNIFIPPIAVIIDTFTHAAAQFGGQEILHKLLGNHRLSKEILATVATVEISLQQIAAQPKGETEHAVHPDESSARPERRTVQPYRVAPRPKNVP